METNRIGIANAKRAMKRLLGRLNEYFRLRQRLAESEALPASLRADLYRSVDSAQRRMDAARLLLDARLPHDALILFARGATELADAYLRLKAAPIAPTATNATELFHNLSETLGEDDLAPGSRFGRAFAYLGAFDLERLDQLPVGEATERCVEIDLMLRWIAARIAPRSPLQLKATRNFRIAMTALALLALPIGHKVWLLSPRNLSHGKPVSASSVKTGGHLAGVVDDNAYSSPAFSTKRELSPWFVIDLGESFIITDVHVFTRVDCCFSEALPLALEVSEDGTYYTELETRSEPFVSRFPWIIKALTARARFVRLRTKGIGVLTLTEVIVYGRPQW